MGTSKRGAQRVLGIMSGTSLDGVDYALCDILSKGERASVKLKGLWRVSYPRKLRNALLAAASNWLSSFEVAQLHHDLGRFYAEHAPRAACDYAGLHGQTIFHNPSKKSPATCQIGEPAYLAAKLKVPVVNQFRSMDIAMGGQGAPLATLFHREVFSVPGQTVAVNNLGGISNVTFLPAQGKILSFDTGPANLLIDYAISHFTKGARNYDRGGAFAERGLPCASVIEKWMGHPFFAEKPPKSTGREEFNHRYFEKCLADCKKLGLGKYDIVATLTDFTARTIAFSYAKHLPVFPDLVILGGGGAANPYLVGKIREELRRKQWEIKGSKILKPVDVTVADALGWPAQSIEAAAFALLAFRTMNLSKGNLPETTGAKRAAVLGQITPAP